jgi:hypothetical protein
LTERRKQKRNETTIVKITKKSNRERERERTQIDKMVNFQRMKDELDGFSTQVSTKMPVVGKASCLTLSVIFVLVKFYFKF